MEVVDLGAIVGQAVESIGPSVAARAQELALSMVPDKPLYVEADPTRSEQIFGNLLTNASKFSSERGHIGVTVQVVGEDGPLRTPSLSGFGMTASASIRRCSRASRSLRAG